MNEDFLTHISHEFNIRKTKNARYSLRSYARDLSIEPSHLSKILRKKIAISEAIISKLGIKLNLEKEAIDKYIKKENELSSQLNTLYFNNMTKWYFFAIIPLFDLDEFEPTPDFIRSKLNITEEEASEALHLLTEMGMITVKEDKTLRLEKRKSMLFVPRVECPEKKVEMSINVRKSLSKKMDEHFTSATEIKTSYIQSIIIPFNDESYPEIIEEMKVVMHKLAKKIDKKVKSKEKLYSMNIAFYPLTK